jgi:hypothetical protein
MGLWGRMVMNIYTMAIMAIVYGHWPLPVGYGMRLLDISLGYWLWLCTIGYFRV